MHTFIKGPLSKQWKLTVSDKYKDYPWNVNYYKGHALKLRRRFASFKFPVGHTNPNKYLDRVNCLKADELYAIGRICGWFLFDGLIPRGAVRAWFLLCRMTSTLLHSHVLKDWMFNSQGASFVVSEYYQAYLDVYGRCHMPSNFHRLLHMKIDFENWGPLRSHWCFPMERLYGSLMVGFARMNKSRVTQAIVNAVPNLYVKGDPPDHPSSVTLTEVPALIDTSDSNLRKHVTNGCRWVKTNVDMLGNRWKSGDFVCVLPAGSSVDSSCVYVVAGILQGHSDVQNQSSHQTCHMTYLVLRRIEVMSATIVRGLSALGLTLPTDWEKSVSTQLIIPVDHRTLEEVHISPIVKYRHGNNAEFIIPFCGYVDFRLGGHPMTNYRQDTDTPT